MLKIGDNMEHSRKQKLLMIVALIVGIASLSVGFAAFSVSLNISSSASVTPSSDTFSVKFSRSPDSLVEGSVGAAGWSTGIETYDAVIDNSGNPTVRGFGATFTEPDQFVEYGVYARNEGEYTAYLNSVNFIGENVCIGDPGTTESLVQAACNSINIIVEIDGIMYSKTSGVINHNLASGEGELIHIYVEYTTGPSVDGPFSVILPDVALVYSTVDDSSIQPTVSESFMNIESGDIKTIGSVVSIGDENFYVIGYENGNVKLLSMYNLYVGNITDENGNLTPIEHPTGIQARDAIGYNWDSVNSVAKYPFIGVTDFSSDTQKGTNYSDYEGSFVEGYVNNYASYLEGLGANIKDARLIKIEELETLGCSSTDYTCSGAPDFVYKTSYWSESPYDNSWIWFVNGDARFLCSPYYDNSVLGVRPVIEISLSEF